MTQSHPSWGILAAAILGLASAGITCHAANEGTAAGKAQTAPTWGPYTVEGAFLSDRTLERFAWPFGQWFLQPYAEARLVYDDNVFLNAEVRDRELYAMFTPGAMLLYGNPRQDYLFLDAALDFTTLDTGNTDAVDGHRVTVGLHRQGARTQGGFANEYREVRDVDTQVGTRLKHRSNTTTADLDTRVTAKTSVGVLGRYMIHQFDDDAYADYCETVGGGRVSWQVRPRTSVYGQAAHGWVDVEQDRDAFGSAQYDEATLGVYGRPRQRLETSGQVGVQHRYFENDAIDGITREVASVRIAGNPLELFRAWMGVTAGLHPAINAQGYTVFDTRIEPGISRRLFVDRVIGTLSGLWGRTDYEGTSDPSSDDAADNRVYDGREDRYWGINAGVDWWIGRYWCVGAGYSYLNSDSDADNRVVDGRRTDPASFDVNRWMIRAAFNR